MIVPIETIWKALWMMFEPLADGSPHPGVPKGVVLQKVMSMSQVKTKDLITQRIALIWITRCLPRLFSPEQPDKDFSDDSKGTFKLEPATSAKLSERLAQMPAITPEFKEKLKRELREEISGRKSAAQLAALRKRTNTQPEIETMGAPARKKQRQSVEKSATQPSILTEDLTTPAEEEGADEEGAATLQGLPLTSNSTPQKAEEPDTTAPRAKRKAAEPQRSPKKPAGSRKAIPKSTSVPGGVMDKEALQESIDAEAGVDVSNSPLGTSQSGAAKRAAGIPSSKSFNPQSGGVSDLRAEVSQLRLLVASLVGEVETSRIQAQRKEKFIEHEFSNFRAELNLLKIQLAVLSKGQAGAAAKPMEAPRMAEMSQRSSDLKRTQSSPAGAFLKPPMIPRTASGTKLPQPL